jgi:hypothetical protein
MAAVLLFGIALLSVCQIALCHRAYLQTECKGHLTVGAMSVTTFLLSVLVVVL